MRSTHAAASGCRQGAPGGLVDQPLGYRHASSMISTSARSTAAEAARRRSSTVRRGRSVLATAPSASNRCRKYSCCETARERSHRHRCEQQPPRTTLGRAHLPWRQPPDIDDIRKSGDHEATRTSVTVTNGTCGTNPILGAVAVKYRGAGGRQRRPPARRRPRIARASTCKPSRSTPRLRHSSPRRCRVHRRPCQCRHRSASRLAKGVGRCRF